MFKVRLKIELYHIDPRSIVTAMKDVDLPFVPYLGLMYEHHGKIKQVRWTGERFNCELPDRKHYTEESLQRGKDLLDQDGWETTFNF